MVFSYFKYTCKLAGFFHRGKGEEGTKEVPDWLSI